MWHFIFNTANIILKKKDNNCLTPLSCLDNLDWLHHIWTCRVFFIVCVHLKDATKDKGKKKILQSTFDFKSIWKKKKKLR